MEKNLRERERINQHSQPSAKGYLVLALIIIAVVGLGLFALNQFLEFRYKAEFLGSPCQFCEKMNKHISCEPMPASDLNLTSLFPAD